MIMIVEKKNTRMSQEEKKFHADFGIRVRDKRNEKGITSEKLAEFAGISYQWVSAIENGHPRRGASLYVAFKLAKALGTTINELLGMEIDVKNLEVDEDTAWEMMKRARERKRLRSA